MRDLSNIKYLGTDGSGNQKKFWVGSVLVKLNSKYHEAEKEYSAYKIGEVLGLQVVEYRKSEYFYNGKKYLGCECNTFLKDSEESITLADCLSTINIPDKLSAVDYFNMVVNMIYLTTQGSIDKEVIVYYLKSILIFDYLICNSDRHLTNIEIIKGRGYYRLASLYDHGQAFLKRNGIASKKQLEAALRGFKTLPFSRNPKKNLIDLDFAKNFCRNIDTNRIKKLDINSFHKELVLYRIQELLKDK